MLGEAITDGGAVGDLTGDCIGGASTAGGGVGGVLAGGTGSSPVAWNILMEKRTNPGGSA